jgi:hypothetical protein
MVAMADLARAAKLMEAGDWQAAHRIVQDGESELACWGHGIVHAMEGDHDNARYWYRRARRRFSGAEAVATEIAAFKEATTRRGAARR